MTTKLGRILREREYVRPACAGTDEKPLTCNWPGRSLPVNKPTAIRRARQHADTTGHTVVLYIEHYQVVTPDPTSSSAARVAPRSTAAERDAGLDLFPESPTSGVPVGP